MHNDDIIVLNATCCNDKRNRTRYALSTQHRPV